jgi:hypothetical protein
MLDRTAHLAAAAYGAATVALGTAGIAAAAPPATLTDPAGDAGTAPDITAVTVSNDSRGNILFRVALTNFTPES